MGCGKFSHLSLYPKKDTPVQLLCTGVVVSFLFLADDSLNMLFGQMIFGRQHCGRRPGGVFPADGLIAQGQFGLKIGAAAPVPAVVLPAGDVDACPVHILLDLPHQFGRQQLVRFSIAHECLPVHSITIRKCTGYSKLIQL